jgi:hypothetical protein
MPKSLDDILAERSRKEAYQQPKPWKNRLIELFTEAGLLEKREGDAAFYGYGHDEMIKFQSREPKVDVALHASKTIEALVSAAEKVRAEKLLAEHQEELIKHYDELA